MAKKASKTKTTKAKAKTEAPPAPTAPVQEAAPQRSQPFRISSLNFWLS